MVLKQSFSAVSRKDAEILILGSMPGEMSLEKQQYYGHPRNLFWPILGQILKFPPETSYEERLTLLCNHKIALWDVLEFCERPGSLDSNIVKHSEKANNFPHFLENQPQIKTICFNGQKALQLFKKHFLKKHPEWAEQYALIQMPSTSPANASMKKDEKIRRWVEGLGF